MNQEQIKLKSLELHHQHHGKWETHIKVPLETRTDLTLAYSPGVAEPCLQIADNAELSYDYTNRGNTVAVISNGTAVLGLGNIGPLAAQPVMEGKAALFKRFANIDAVPLVIAETDPAKLSEIIRSLAPSFGGVNLEDIKAPDCFVVENSLQDIGIPVVHDDQHGTAIVALAALINSLSVVNKTHEPVRIVIVGAGAAGSAIASILISAIQAQLLNISDIIVCDSHGILSTNRTDLNRDKQLLASQTNHSGMSGSVNDACMDADVIIGVSKPGGFTTLDIQVMRPNGIVFALANPTPEIMPDEALAFGAAIVATGRSDFPNQINNVLAFPGLFRGLLDNRIKQLTTHHKIAAAQAIASLVPIPTATEILPDIFDTRIVPAIVSALSQ